MALYTLNPTDAQRRELVDNIIAAWDAASDDQVSRGSTWYANAHDLARLVGHGNAEQGAGIIAALSANVGWGQNRKMALSMAQEGTARGLPMSLDRAARIMAGEAPTDVLSGSKTRAFFDNIAHPHTSTAVTIDRHAHDVAVNQRFGNDRRGLENLKRYEVFARAYREAAERLTARNPRAGEIRPSEVQAVTWVYWTENVTPERYRHPE